MSLAVPAGVLAYSGYFLIQDFRGEYSGSQGEKEIARVINSSQDVKRRPSKTFMWYEVKEGQTLYARDSMRTGEDSSLELGFSDGSQLQLGQSSLVVLEEASKSPSVHLISGDLQFSSGKTGLAIQLDNKILDTRHASGRMSRSGEINNLIVDKGQVVISDRSTHRSAVIHDHQLAQLKPGGVLNEESSVSLRAELVTPKANTIVREGEVQFQWRALQKLAQVHLELAKDPYFTASLGPSSTPNALLLSDKRTLLRGTYYWRLKDAGRVISDTAKFTVVQNSPLNLIQPQQKSVLSHDDSSELLFEWSSSPYFQDYTLWLAQDSQFKNRVQTQKVHRGSSCFLKVDVPGSYFWKVEAFAPDPADHEVSGTHEFTLRGPQTLTILPTASPKVVVAPSVVPSLLPVLLPNLLSNSMQSPVPSLVPSDLPSRLPSPVLALLPRYPTPAAQTAAAPAVVSSFMKAIRPKSLPSSLPKPILSVAPSLAVGPRLVLLRNHTKIKLKKTFILTWGKVHGADAYLVELSTSPQFTILALSTTTRRNFQLVKEDLLQTGVYYWRVKSMTAGVVGPPSLVFDLTVVP